VLFKGVIAGARPGGESHSGIHSWLGTLRVAGRRKGRDRPHPSLRPGKGLSASTMTPEARNGGNLSGIAGEVNPKSFKLPDRSDDVGSARIEFDKPLSRSWFSRRARPGLEDSLEPT
jgi:hypothetical protein